MSSAFKRLFGRLSSEEFFASYFDNTPLHVKSAGITFTDLFNYSDIEAIINWCGLKFPNFRMVNKGEEIPLDSITVNNRSFGIMDDHIINPLPIYSNLTMGHTLILQSIQRYH